MFHKKSDEGRDNCLFDKSSDEVVIIKSLISFNEDVLIFLRLKLDQKLI